MEKTGVAKPNTVVFVLVLAFSALLPFALYRWPRSASEFGDSFGFMAALAGTLALFYLSWSVWLQARANRAAAHAVKIGSKVTALVALIEHQRLLVERYREWERAAQSDEKKRLWGGKRKQSLETYSAMVKELRQLAELDVSIDALDETD